jgi:acyl-CoA synthetase (AMP-forming)/AMP-acid ligase II
VNAGIERTYHHLLSDILTLRKVLERQLSPSIRQDLIEDKEVFVGLLIPGGYEFVVGFFAILALGAAVVPLGNCAHYL